MVCLFGMYDKSDMYYFVAITPSRKIPVYSNTCRIMDRMQRAYRVVNH